jgi:hypothetical protein
LQQKALEYLPEPVIQHFLICSQFVYLHHRMTFRRFKKILALCFLIFLSGSVCFSQPGADSSFVAKTGVTHKPLLITPTFHYGFIIAHHSEMLFLTQGHVSIAELCISRPSYGEKFWNQLFRFPEPGISICVFDLGSPQYLGNLYSICPYIDFPINRSLRSKICFRAGGGLSYLTKPFDRISNYKNIAIGSHLNGFMNFRFTLKEEISPRLRLDFGLGISHCSNGAFKMPNLGLNMPTLDLGIGYSLFPCPSYRRFDTLPACDKKPFLAVSLAGALSQINPPGGHDFGAIVISAAVYRRWNHKNMWNAGLEIFYNEANYREIVRTDANVKRSRYIQPAAKMGYSLCIGRLSMPLDLGFYFYDKVNGEAFPMYEKVGLRYQISKNMLIGTSLKTYFARAEFFEWGITYRFLSKAE